MQRSGSVASAASTQDTSTSIGQDLAIASAPGPASSQGNSSSIGQCLAIASDGVPSTQDNSSSIGQVLAVAPGDGASSTQGNSSSIGQCLAIASGNGASSTQGNSSSIGQVLAVAYADTTQDNSTSALTCFHEDAQPRDGEVDDSLIPTPGLWIEKSPPQKMKPGDWNTASWELISLNLPCPANPRVLTHTQSCPSTYPSGASRPRSSRAPLGSPVADEITPPPPKRQRRLVRKGPIEWKEEESEDDDIPEKFEAEVKDEDEEEDEDEQPQELMHVQTLFKRHAGVDDSDDDDGLDDVCDSVHDDQTTFQDYDFPRCCSWSSGGLTHAHATDDPIECDDNGHYMYW